ncbi:MAG: hypothetical protein K1X89_24000, partial [Myxococcaceae bacterium]|nr:hypothetical protein [Myxococcaceae bacterium]
SGGGAAGGTASGGGAAGGSASGGGSGGAGGGQAPWVFASLSLPSTNGGPIRAISGNANELYVATNSGKLFHRVGTGAFTEVMGLSGGINGMWVSSDGKVFVSRFSTLSVCSSGCDTASNYVPTSTVSNEQMLGLCGASASEVYAVGQRDSANVGFLWKWNGTMWTKVSNDLGITQPGNCVVASDGTVYIAGRTNISTYAQSAVSVEMPDLTALGSQASQQLWWGVGTAGNEVFAVGSYHRIIRRGSGGSWSLVVNPTTVEVNTFKVVGGPSGSLAAAAGTFPSSPGKGLWWWNGSTWSAATNDLPFVTSAEAIYVAGPNEIYFGGADGSGAPTLVRAKR